MVICGGTPSNFWIRYDLQSGSLRLPILTAKPCLFLISHPPMLHCPQMLWKLSRWINLMVEGSTSSMTQLSLNQIWTLASEDTHSRWQHPWGNRKTCRPFLKNMDLMSWVWRPGAYQYALLRARTAAWPGFSLSKKILSIKNQWLRHWSKEQAMSIFSFQNSTVSWTPFKWSVLSTIWK